MIELQVVSLLSQLLAATGHTVERELNVGKAVVDLATDIDGCATIFEVKSRTPRIGEEFTKDVAQGLWLQQLYKARFGSPASLCLVYPGVIARSARDQVAEQSNDTIDIWDGRRLLAMADELPLLTAEVQQLVDSLHTEATSKGDRDAADGFVHRLSEIEPGKQQWAVFQATVFNILEFVFSPPLGIPVWEEPNTAHTNRRDIIIPNYAETGFWAFLRSHYQADYVVVDTKNLRSRVGKNAVVQVANYLDPLSTGNFGIIVSRSTPAANAKVVQREQWLLNRKLIVFLDDADLVELLELRASKRDTSEPIRQKIQSFRLSI